MIDARAKQKIEAKFGSAIRYPKDCEALSKSIYTNCKKHISSSTLKRLFGFVKNVKQPHGHTLDVVANYVGYKHWEELLHNIDKDENSSFFLAQSVEAKSLKAGNKIEFSYEPNRKVVLKYLGKNSFDVINSINSKLKVGDVIKLSSIVLHHNLLASDVKRNGISLGKFTAGKLNGITKLKIIE